jgi:hypothetical protein
MRTENFNKKPCRSTVVTDETILCCLNNSASPHRKKVPACEGRSFSHFLWRVIILLGAAETKRQELQNNLLVVVLAVCTLSPATAAEELVACEFH